MSNLRKQSIKGGQMRFNKTIIRVIAISSAAGIAGLFSGCGLGPNSSVSDEFARISSQEVANMGDNSSTMIGSPLSKIAVAGDTTYYDWSVHPYTWDAAIGSYVRSATFSNLTDGYDRTRVDTLTFHDANNNHLQHPTLATVKSIDHIRNVTRTKGGNELNIRVVMNSVISLTPDTTHVKNGTITGTFNGEKVVGTGVIKDVTRQRTNGYWQFPRSGAIACEFPRRSYDVEFLGSGNARLTVTNKTTDKTSVITYHVDER
jgi:hypothetical protein